MYEIERLSFSLLKDAIVNNASDIHLIPSPNDYYIQYRIHGKIFKKKNLSSKYAERLISHLKYQSGMDIGERRKAQSTMMTITIQNQHFDLRLSTLPAMSQESLAIRISKASFNTSPKNLPLIPSKSLFLEKILLYSHGLVIIAGPTGSGKTTTLYSLIQELILQRNKMVITVEDPIERTIDQAIQVQVNEKAGIFFEQGLRSILRHDPDIIIIGEIRDRKTAKVALEAALTGHLVISTLHTHNCYSAILRLLDFGLSRVELAEAARMFIAQRLVMTICPICQFQNIQCPHFSNRTRKAIYEKVEGELLSSQILQLNQVCYRSLKREVALAWALGYVDQIEVERLIEE
ncbi:competence type IV pilus ATPase ComGA [Alkalihalobacillus trypoxylicola]|uniref:Bacterial type II secretion system protein E domain-containing protein n=1 Tax=Alkalihalobacillus trypoxylicola TaxID=519424 RepID=A0A161PDN8_9BACI|nr:competence type IV pilus ATPase ComGA [Alkalihalobacillus trypoxylicola]KYG30992.1 hypothetical protein AZF04_18575 [Alkalihalobacillus trypoxylicola]